MKKTKRKLSLNKLRITKIENLSQIIGGNPNESSQKCATDSSNACGNDTGGTGGGISGNANKTALPTEPLPKNDGFNTLSF